MTTEDKLFDELENARWFAMNQLADLAEEQGHTEMALGYRWLAGKRKYPKQKRVGGNVESHWRWARGGTNTDGEHFLCYTVWAMCRRKTSKSPKILVKSAAQAAGGILIRQVEIK